MKIGVLSDTHMPERASCLPQGLFDAFKGVELILHAGDLVELSVLDELKKIAPVKAVCGNMDNLKSREILKEKEVITVGNFKIGLIHGRGSPSRLISLVKSAFTEKLDVIIFGHSHTPCIQKESGILFFNPGSPTDTVFAPYLSCGLLEVGTEVNAQIVRL